MRRSSFSAYLLTSHVTKSDLEIGVGKVDQ